ncbi:MAG: hypothetical protein IT257_02680 [Chitinophagaceae bacterium]|nr:hypothetical protein [Chitinophagaceae bacterium]
MIKKFLPAIVLVSLSLFLCNSLVFAQEKKRGNPYAEGENIYKHYAGSIGGRKVVLDLVWGFQGGSNFGGSYYYFTDSPQVNHMSILEPPTFEHTEKLRGIVEPEENPWNYEDLSFDDADVTWDFHIDGNILTGVYRKKSTGEEHALYLVETYGKSIAFDMVIGSDRVMIPSSSGGGAAAEIFTLGISPSPLTTNITEMDFVNKELLKFTQIENIQSEYIADYYKAMRVNFIKGSKIYFTQLFASGNAVNTESAEYKSHLTRRLLVRPVYNDTGFLVVKKYFFDGEKNTEQYLNLDLKRSKRLVLADILKINERWLSAMIEAAFRSKYNMGNTAKLNQWLTVDRLPVSQKYSLSPRGIIFYYDKKSLIKDKSLTFYEADFAVFISYEQLRSMMKRDFAARIWSKL